MLYKAMKNKIQKEFPSLKFSSDDKSKLIIIPPRHVQVGSIEIQDDFTELTIFVGNFTHWHVGYCDEKSGSEEQIEDIVSDVSDFLADMFNDKIFMWSDERGGGFEYIDEGFETNKQGFVWSGPRL